MTLWNPDQMHAARRVSVAKSRGGDVWDTEQRRVLRGSKLLYLLRLLLHAPPKLSQIYIQFKCKTTEEKVSCAVSPPRQSLSFAKTAKAVLLVALAPQITLTILESRFGCSTHYIGSNLTAPKILWTLILSNGLYVLCEQLYTCMVFCNGNKCIGE